VSASRPHRRIIICAAVCALLAFALTGVAPAGANQHTATARLLAQEQSYSSYSTPHTSGAGDAAAQAQERYYSSYGDPQPLSVSRRLATAGDIRWLLIALAVAVALAIITASATLERRLRIRRRAVRVTA
jgi:hypothetical protein